MLGPGQDPHCTTAGGLCQGLVLTRQTARKTARTGIKRGPCSMPRGSSRSSWSFSEKEEERVGRERGYSRTYSSPPRRGLTEPTGPEDRDPFRRPWFAPRCSRAVVLRFTNLEPWNMFLGPGSSPLRNLFLSVERVQARSGTGSAPGGAGTRNWFRSAKVAQERSSPHGFPGFPHSLWRPVPGPRCQLFVTRRE
jgi:hypothetical protein